MQPEHGAIMATENQVFDQSIWAQTEAPGNTMSVDQIVDRKEMTILVRVDGYLRLVEQVEFCRANNVVGSNRNGFL